MICILSPAKTMIASHHLGDTCASLATRSLPLFKERASILGKVLKKKSKAELKSLCGVSDALSAHVKGLYTSLLVDDDDDALSAGTRRYNQAALMFDGPAFRGLAAKDISPQEGEGLQKHLRILTGLYGYVKPGDLIQEHRLCMGTKLVVCKEQKDLYEFWGPSLAEGIMRDVQQQLQELQGSGSDASNGDKKTPASSSFTPLLINCASQEYAKSVLPHLHAAAAALIKVEDGKGTEERELIRVVECVFLDGGTIKSAFAKRARGLMSRFVCTNQILHGADSEVNKIKQFNYEGYRFSAQQSSDNRLVFTRAPGDIPPPLPPPPKKKKLSSVSSSTTETDTDKKPTKVLQKRKGRRGEDYSDGNDNGVSGSSDKKTAKKAKAVISETTHTITTAAGVDASGQEGVTRTSRGRVTRSTTQHNSS